MTTLSLKEKHSYRKSEKYGIKNHLNQHKSLNFPENWSLIIVASWNFMTCPDYAAEKYCPMKQTKHFFWK